MGAVPGDGIRKTQPCGGCCFLDRHLHPKDVKFYPDFVG
ncbi:hypothetical protein B4135_1170 [Caldibacillus debilis]|uniref:Uncharacterized protein n=1 Tax=Caldibacillus debilis TaxID=301148 RepID=A0A150MDR1_9BACI|nr:hypothetical protein B4135_1170 [Caldibacillus debilis]